MNLFSVHRLLELLKTKQRIQRRLASGSFFFFPKLLDPFEDFPAAGFLRECLPFL
ncbi:hypothetical protein HanPSC8_Chr05g0229101 [Helianthus annuus]|nr:hypothetical protein HanPSC8_Chr05g0229101 [Helianthus annuus]